jgi:hypothetical protein
VNESTDPGTRDVMLVTPPSGFTPKKRLAAALKMAERAMLLQGEVHAQLILHTVSGGDGKPGLCFFPATLTEEQRGNDERIAFHWGMTLAIDMGQRLGALEEVHLVEEAWLTPLGPLAVLPVTEPGDVRAKIAERREVVIITTYTPGEPMAARVASIEQHDGHRRLAPWEEAQQVSNRRLSAFVEGYGHGLVLEHRQSRVN